MAHFPTNGTLPFMSEVHALFAHIAAKMGVPLPHWSKGLKAVLLKGVGNLNIDKLRAILLIKANYNWLPKLLVSKRIIPRSNALGLILDKKFWSRSGLRAVKVAPCCCLFCNCLRQLRRPGGLGSFDAAQCYNHIVHLFCSLAAQCWVCHSWQS